MLYQGNKFKHSKFNLSKAIDFGFEKENDCYILKKPLNNEFNIIVTIKKDEIDTKIIEKETNEEYVLIYAKNATGEFVGKIKTLYDDFLEEIKVNCFDYEVFKTNQAKEIISYINKKYDIKAEYLWEKFPNNAIFRNKQNKKWFLAILTASKKTLGLKGLGEIEVIDLKNEPDEIIKLVDNKKFFKGYHMNKKHWYTVILDDCLSSDEIFKLIDKSFEIVR